MKSVLRLPFPVLAFLCFACLAVRAADESAWPFWRGTSGAGLAAPGAQPPLKWSETQNIKWKTRIPGEGYSTPIIWQDRIFLLAAIEAKGSPAAAPGGSSALARASVMPGPDTLYDWAVIAINRGSGKIEWQKTARREAPHEGHHPSTRYASASPVTDGERLWVPFGSRGYYCYDLQGNLLWEKDLGDMQVRGPFGEASSPALAGDLLIIIWDHEDQSYIVALDKKTGAEVWRKARAERSSWSTPLITEVDGRQHAIVAASNRTRSYDAKTGELIWEAGGLTGNVIPMPVVGHGMVYVMSGFRGFAIQAIKLSSRGDVTDTDNIVWHLRRSAPYVPSPVLSGNRLYMSKSNDASLSCLNALTGEPFYQDQPLAGVRSIYASALAANGHLYVVGREGLCMVLKDGPKFEVVATNELSDQIDASPVMLGKELFLRGHEFLYCIAEG
ncbi:MAG: hypothetical protein EXS38_00030 [Opitutus sp.]|nr:hypothetical protein [Opitutus sp.]